jgi:hypothetical protein
MELKGEEEEAMGEGEKTRDDGELAWRLFEALI